MWVFLQKKLSKIAIGEDRDPCGGSVQILSNNLSQEILVCPSFKTLKNKMYWNLTTLVCSKVSKDSNRRRGGPEGSLFNSFYTKL